MTEYIAIAAGVGVVLLVAGVLVIRFLVRRASRRMSRFGLRLLEMRAKYGPPGPRRDVTRLRYRLHAELRATRDMLETAPQGLIFRANAASILQELASTAVAIDTELVAIERFIDPLQQRTAVAAIRPQVTDLIETTYSARQTILRTAAEDRAKQLSALRENVATQAAALENYRKNGRELSL